VRRAIGFIAAPHRSYSSCTQYRENVRDARAEIAGRGLRDVEVTYVADWYAHPGFIEASADQVEQAVRCLPTDVRSRASLVFTAHSIPSSMAERYPYEQQYLASGRLIADRVRLRTGMKLPHVSVYQSRSGRPEDPWLGPDICEYLRETRGDLDAVVVCPAGFLSDHIEILYDLDIEAAQVAREMALPLVRARAVNDHPAFTGMMADVVLATVERYRRGVPLQIVGRV
jgi:ferrochelatase